MCFPYLSLSSDLCMCFRACVAKSRSYCSSSEAYSIARPFCVTALQTIEGLLLNSGYSFNSKPSCLTISCTFLETRPPFRFRKLLFLWNYRFRMVVPPTVALGARVTFLKTIFLYQQKKSRCFKFSSDFLD